MDTEKIVALAVVFIAFAILAAVSWRVIRRGSVTARQAEPNVGRQQQAGSWSVARTEQDTEGLCMCCRQREAKVLMPQAVYRRRDHALNPHATRNYGLPPRAMVQGDEARGALICVVCAPVLVRVLEAFLAKQYADICDLVGKQGTAAASFEARGMMREARKCLELDP